MRLYVQKHGQGVVNTRWFPGVAFVNKSRGSGEVSALRCVVLGAIVGCGVVTGDQSGTND